MERNKTSQIHNVSAESLAVELIREFTNFDAEAYEAFREKNKNLFVMDEPKINHLDINGRMDFVFALVDAINEVTPDGTYLYFDPGRPARIGLINKTVPEEVK